MKKYTKIAARAAVGAIAAALVMSASTAGANEGFVEARTVTLDTSDNGFAALTGSDKSVGVGFLAGYELDVLPIGEFRVLGSYAVDGFIGDRFQGDLRANWGRNRFMVGADYGINIVGEWLRPLARVSVGYSRQSLQIESDGATYLDYSHGLSWTAAGGLEAVIGGSGASSAAISRLSVGVNLLFGYTGQTTAHFDEMEAQDIDGDDEWTRGTYDAGSIQASGFTWNLGASLRYRFGR